MSMESMESPVGVLQRGMAKSAFFSSEGGSQLDLEGHDDIIEIEEGEEEEEFTHDDEMEGEGVEFEYQDNDTIQILSDEECVLQSPLQMPKPKDLPPASDVPLVAEGEIEKELAKQLAGTNMDDKKETTVTSAGSVTMKGEPVVAAEIMEEAQDAINSGNEADSAHDTQVGRKKTAFQERKPHVRDNILASIYYN